MHLYTIFLRLSLSLSIWVVSVGVIIIFIHHSCDFAFIFARLYAFVSIDISMLCKPNQSLMRHSYAYHYDLSIEGSRTFIIFTIRDLQPFLAYLTFENLDHSNATSSLFDGSKA